MRQALERSSNAAAVRLAQAAGLDGVIRTARDVGFTSRMTPVPALALGSFEVTPLELAAAYATLREWRHADGGAHGVRDGRGPPRASRGRRRGRRAVTSSTLSADEAYLVTNLLRGVMDRGTGAGVRALGLTRRRRGQDRDHERHARRVVCRATRPAPGRGRLGRVRRRHAPRGVRRRRRAADLDRLHARGRDGRGSRGLHGAACRSSSAGPAAARPTEMFLAPLTRSRRAERRAAVTAATVGRPAAPSWPPRSAYRPLAPPKPGRLTRRAERAPRRFATMTADDLFLGGPGGDRSPGAASQARRRARERSAPPPDRPDRRAVACRPRPARWRADTCRSSGGSRRMGESRLTADDGGHA